MPTWFKVSISVTSIEYGNILSLKLLAFNEYMPQSEKKNWHARKKIKLMLHNLWDIITHGYSTIFPFTKQTKQSEN